MVPGGQVSFDFKKEYRYSGRNMATLILAGSGTILLLIINLTLIIYIILNIEKFDNLDTILNTIFGASLCLSSNIFFVYLILNRTLILDEKGIKFYIWKKLKYNIEWNDIQQITHIPLNYYTILIFLKHSNDSIKIGRIKEQELVKAYKVMKGFSTKHGFYCEN